MKARFVRIVIVAALGLGLAGVAGAQAPAPVIRPPATIPRPAAPAQRVTPRERPPLADRELLDIGAVACKSNSDCPTRECWDGYCCNQSCPGRCQSCGLPGRKGACTQVPDGQDPRRSCTIVAGGHPACNAACYSGQCAFPDVGTTCGQCSACDGTGRCVLTPADDQQCGVVDCDRLDSFCRNYHDLRANRCAALGVCAAANDPAACNVYTDRYSGVDPDGIRRECATGKAMECYRRGSRWVWQDGSVIKYCDNGEVCRGCAPPATPKPEDWTPPKGTDPRD